MLSQHLAELNVIDLIALTTIIISAAIGVSRGIIKEVMSLIIWIASIFCMLKYGKVFATFSENIGNSSLKIAIGYILAFSSVMVVGNFISWVTTKILDFSGLGIINRLLGSIFGILRGALLIAIVILIGKKLDYQNTQSWKESIVIEKSEPIAEWINATILQYAKQEIDKKIEKNEASVTEEEVDLDNISE